MKLEPPNDVDALCVALDIGLKRRARLSDEMGEAFIPWLQRAWLWTKRQDSPRLLHRNPGAGRTDYTDIPALAMNEEPEAVPEDYQNVLVMEAHGRSATYRQHEAKDQHAVEQAKHVGQQIRDLAVAINRSGGDPVEFLAGIQREVSAKRDQLRDAA